MKETCAEWFGGKKSEKLAGELLREDVRGLPAGMDGDLEVGKDTKKIVELYDRPTAPSPPLSVGIPDGIDIIVAEPITDRKSAFVGRACKITDPSQVCPPVNVRIEKWPTCSIPGALDPLLSHDRSTHC